LKARRKGLKNFGVFGENEPVTSVIERHEAAVTMQRDLKKAQVKPSKLCHRFLSVYPGLKYSVGKKDDYLNLIFVTCELGECTCVFE
jgi:hypothetical protein